MKSNKDIISEILDPDFECDCKDRKVLVNKYLDVFMWLDHDEGICNLDDSGRQKIHFTCANFGYHACSVHSRIILDENIIALNEPKFRTFYVPCPRTGEKAGVNPDFRIATAVSLNCRGDCRCVWTTELGNRVYEVQNQIQFQTVPS